MHKCVALFLGPVILLPINIPTTPSPIVNANIPFGRIAAPTTNPATSPTAPGTFVHASTQAGPVPISQVLQNRRPTEITTKFLFIYHVRNASLRKRWTTPGGAYQPPER